MKTRQKGFATVLCAVLLTGILAACGQTSALSVSTVKAKSADTLTRSEYSGTIHAATSMTVIPNVPGKVSAVSVVLGQEVKAGDTLMQLDKADALLSLKQAQASYDSARANYEKTATAGTRQAETQARQAMTSAENELRDATTNYTTAKSQFDSGSTVSPAKAAYDSAKGEVDRITLLVSIGEESEYSLQNAQNTLSTAAAQLENAKATAQTAMNAADSRLNNAQSALATAKENYNLTVSSLNPENVKGAKANMESAKVGIEVAQKRVNDCTVKAPIDGSVSAVAVKVGDMASQQTEAFHVLGQVGGMELEASVTESAAAKLTAGMTAEVTLTASGEVCEGTVTALSPMADEETGLYLVKVLLSESESLKDGMQATVRFRGTDDSSVLVPEKSILTKDEKSVVYCIQDGKAVSVEITVLEQQGAYRAVQGLTVDAEVVLQGADKVASGESVRIVSTANT